MFLWPLNDYWPIRKASTKLEFAAFNCVNLKELLSQSIASKAKPFAEYSIYKYTEIGGKAGIILCLSQQLFFVLLTWWLYGGKINSQHKNELAFFSHWLRELDLKKRILASSFCLFHRTLTLERVCIRYKPSTWSARGQRPCGPNTCIEVKINHDDKLSLLCGKSLNIYNLILEKLN